MTLIVSSQSLIPDPRSPRTPMHAPARPNLSRAALHFRDKSARLPGQSLLPVTSVITSRDDIHEVG